MTTYKTLVEFLGELTPLEVELRRSDTTLAVAVVVTGDGKRVLFVERTYREGICFIFNPTPEEIEVAREGDLWKLWNSKRAEDLYGAI